MQPSVRDLFARFLDEHPAARRAQFESWRAQHSEHAAELDDFYAELEHLRQVLDLPDRSIAAHLVAQHGAQADPGITLDPSESGDSRGPAIDLSPHLPTEGDSSRRYRVRREVARGGMGTILEVWDRDLRRRVAMKIARRSSRGFEAIDSRSLARFLEEAQVTGQLDHPGVVPVHELGLDADGQVFFTMRLVRGRDLETALREMEGGTSDWTLTRALGSLLRVCEAVAYAHTKGVIHRDLKPANVMVGRFGEVYVMDWGLAKVLGREDPAAQEPEAGESLSRVASLRGDLEDSDSASPVFTQDGEVVGTPAYMSPEQARGEVKGLGPPSDVYAVGAILYRMLAGVRPFHSDRRQTAREVLVAVATRPPTPISRLARQAPAELVAICEKAMSHDPGRRYPTMEAMADDLRAFLEGRVVHAFGHGPWLELRKWVGRNRAVATTAILAVILVLTISLRAAMVEAKVNRNLREREVHLSSLISDDIVNRDPAGALAIALRMTEGADSFPVRSAILGAMRRLQEDSFLADFFGVAAPQDGRFLIGWYEPTGKVRVWEVEARHYGAEFEPPVRGRLHFHVSPGGERAIGWSAAGGGAWLLDLEQGRWTPLGGTGEPGQGVVRAVFTSDGDRVVSGGLDGTVALWSAADGRRLAALGSHQGTVTSLEVHPAGRFALSISGSAGLEWSTDRTLRVWDLDAGAAAHVHNLPAEAEALACHPTDPVVAVGDLMGGVHLFDLEDGQSLPAPPARPDPVWALAFHPGGDLLALGHETGMALLDRADRFREVRLPGFPHGLRGVKDVDFDGEGRLLSCGFDRVGWTWRLERRRLGWTVRASVPARGHYHWINAGRWLGRSDRFVTITQYGVHIWFAQTNPCLPRLLDRSGPVQALALAPDASRLFVGRTDLAVYRFEPGVRIEEVYRVPPPAGGVTPLWAGMEGADLLVVWVDGTLQRLDPEDGSERVAPLALGARVERVEHASGLLLVAGEGGRAWTVDLAAPKFEARAFAAGDPITAMAIHPSGGQIALGTSQAMVRWIDLESGEQTNVGPLPTATRSQTSIYGLSFHPTRDELATGGPDGVVRFWDPAKPTYPVGATSPGHTVGPIWYRDGGREVLRQAQWGGNLQVVDRATLEQRSVGEVVRHHRSTVSAHAFDAGMKRMLTASKDETATWWDLETGRALMSFSGGHGAPLTAGAISADATWAATGDAAGTVRVWPLDPIEAGRRAMPYTPTEQTFVRLLPADLSFSER